MLKIVEFIQAHDDWAALLTAEPYNLKIKWKDTLVMFLYDQIKSKPCDIVNEARGLILDSADNFKVVRYGLYRFYNVGEQGAAALTGELTAMEKIDGSLIMFYNYKGLWYASTRSTFVASDAEVAHTNLTFMDLIARGMRNSNVKVSQFDQNKTYVFELVSPESQVVIHYADTKLYYLMERNNDTLEEEFTPLVEWDRPKFFPVNTIEQIETYVNTFDGKEFEGVVVQDTNHNRLKVKNVNWLKLHKMAGNGNLVTKFILYMIMSGEDKEFLTYFPEKTEYVEEVRTQYNSIFIGLDYFKTCVEVARPLYPTKKDFAQFMVENCKNSKVRSLFFKIYDGTDIVEWAKKLNFEKFWNMFEDWFIKEDNE